MESVLEKYNTALKYDDKNADLYYRRAGAYYELRKLDLALKDIIKAIELEPDNFHYYHRLDHLVVKLNKLLDEVY